MASAAQLQKGLDKFTADNPWIFDLISEFDGESVPIPWGHVGIGSAYVQYMLPVYNKARAAVSSLDFSPEATSSAEATAAAKALFDQTKSTWSKIQSVGTMAWESILGEGMDVPYEILAVFSGTAFLQMEYGFHLHASGVAKSYLKDVETKVARSLQSGEISQAEAINIVRNTEQALQNHASTINDGLSAISYLDREGFFDTQKRAVGAVSSAVVVVLGLAAIAAAALTIVAVYQISIINSVISEQCPKFEDESKRLDCMKTALEQMPKIDFGAITGQLGKWLAITGIALGAFYLAPAVIGRSVREAHKTRQTSK